MKSTSVLRRIDNLGRVVIPRDIRKNLKIRSGELLEIFINDDYIMLKKHSIINDMKNIAFLYAETFSEISKRNIIIMDRDKVIATSGSLKKEYLNKEISKDFLDLLFKRKNYIENEVNSIKINPQKEEFSKYILIPIITNGDVNGGVLLLDQTKDFTEKDLEIAQFIAKVLSKYAE